LPIYLALTALHWPLLDYLRRLIVAVDGDWKRRLTALGVFGVTFGYVIIGAVVFDYSRWLSSWGSCLILITLTLRTLSLREEVPLIADTRFTRAFGWIVTAIPRVGTVKPF